MDGQNGNGSYAFWWIASYVAPLGIGWGLWYVNHVLAVIVVVVLTLVMLMMGGGRR
jgi:hypothetical protein